MINEDFQCENCKENITKDPNGSVRNHCPHCLYSKHLDQKFPGDRNATCHGLMHPIDIDHKKNKGYMIRHECITCKKQILNKISDDDNFVDFVKLRNKRV